MTNQYNLTVINKSELRNPTFAVFATLPGMSSNESIALAWLIQQINRNNQYRFTWNITWEFIWASQGTAKGYQWNGSGTLPANPLSTSACSAQFDYNGDFQLLPQEGVPDGSHLQITDSPRIPRPSVKPSSVGLTLDGKAICAIDAGPNLEQTFTLHPTYYINAGNYVAGQMVDVDSVTSFQKLVYSGTNTALTATLNPDNTWSVVASDSIDYSRVLEPAMA
ncbi:MAG TPA: hypothetical protein VF070_34090 [Streptosporangiaceae bacterium]